MRQVRLEIKRRLSILVAERSTKRKFIGLMSRAIGAIPVARVQDMTKPGQGRIYRAKNDDVLILRGDGTEFTSLKPGQSIFLPKDTGSAEISEVVSDTELKLKKDFREPEKAAKYLLQQGGSTYKTAPKVDQHAVYDEVFRRLDEGGSVAIFPEGGSHDRTELLPLKAGVAIMALGALARNPDCGIKIVPCGLNYFHAHKFRSRAVLEFGYPLDIPMDLVEMYKAGNRRDAIKAVLSMVTDALSSVTVNTPDFETLQVIQAGRRLYKPANKRLPLAQIVELNRRFVKGYEQFKDDYRVASLRAEILQYNKELYHLGLRDHQLQKAKFGFFKIFFMLIWRVIKLAVLGLLALPGFILFAPVFIATSHISKIKAKEALAGSSVKIQARDVLATWKLLVALGFAPVLYIFYSLLATFLVARYQIVTNPVKLHFVPAVAMIVLPIITFSALKFGETGMDIYKSLRPLVLSLNPSSANTLSKLRYTREHLAAELTELINALGPEVFDDFGKNRLVSVPDALTNIEASERDGIPIGSMDHRPIHSRRRSSISIGSESDMPALGSFSSAVPSRANSPNRSRLRKPSMSDASTSSSNDRSRSASRGRAGDSKKSLLNGFSTGIDVDGTSTGNTITIDQLSQRIRDSVSQRMQQRAHERHRGHMGMTPENAASYSDDDSSGSDDSDDDSGVDLDDKNK